MFRIGHPGRRVRVFGAGVSAASRRRRCGCGGGFLLMRSQRETATRGPGGPSTATTTAGASEISSCQRLSTSACPSARSGRRTAAALSAQLPCGWTPPVCRSGRSRRWVCGGGISRGAGTLVRGGGRPAHGDAPSGSHFLLAAVGTTPGNRGRGLASAVISGGLDEARQRGLPARLETSSQEKVALYERLGFRQDGPPVEIRGGSSVRRLIAGRGRCRKAVSSRWVGCSRSCGRSWSGRTWPSAL